MTKLMDLLRGLAQAAASNDSKSWQDIYEEVRGIMRAEGGFPSYYFTRALYHRDVDDTDNYIDDKTVLRVDQARRRQPARWLFDDKYHFGRHLARNDIPVPRLFGYSIGGYFYDEERRIAIDTLERFRVLIFGLAGAAPNIFVKDLGGRMGQRVFRLTASSIESQIEEAFREARTTALIYEEEQIQHPLVAEVYPESLNTLRIINCMMPDGEVVTISALMRFGAGGGYIDNSSQGGVFIGVDLETGRLRRQARRFFDKGGGLFDTHPDTGFHFEGFQVPFFEEAIDVAEKAMHAIPSPLIGWDVGITEDGPVVIEGNAFADLFGAELAEGGYRNNERFKRFVESLPQLE